MIMILPVEAWLLNDTSEDVEGRIFIQVYSEEGKSVFLMNWIRKSGQQMHAVQELRKFHSHLLKKRQTLLWKQFFWI